MSVLAVIMIWLLPGSVLCLHQGIDHWNGKHIPHIVVFDWDVPHWLTYSLVLALGPFLLVAITIDMILRS